MMLYTNEPPPIVEFIVTSEPVVLDDFKPANQIIKNPTDKRFIAEKKPQSYFSSHLATVSMEAPQLESVDNKLNIETETYSGTDEPFQLQTQLADDLLVAQNSEPAGNQPSLQPDPSTPEQNPFQLQRLQPQQTQRRSITTPGITVITPSAYGKTFGNVSIGLGLQFPARFTNRADGGIGIGVGLGDPQQAVGVDVGLSLVDLDNLGDGTFSLKLHRRLPDDFAVAVGVNNAVRYGLTDGGSSVYGVATKMVRLQDSVEEPFSRLYLSAGVGGGQFRSESDVNNGIESVGVFGSAALRVVEPVNAIAEWTGQDLTLGLSFTPFQDLPLVITPALADVTGNAGDGARFILGIGYGTSF